MVDPLDPTHRREVPDTSAGEDLLVPVMRAGRPVYRLPPLAEVRARTARELDRLHGGLKRLVNPHRYPVGLERGLHDLRTRLILEGRHAPG
jgi:nicotinate phosphoribosyltransferase